MSFVDFLKRPRNVTRLDKMTTKYIQSLIGYTYPLKIFIVNRGIDENTFTATDKWDDAWKWHSRGQRIDFKNLYRHLEIQDCGQYSTMDVARDNIFVITIVNVLI